MNEKVFLKVAGIAALVTGVTTIGVHYVSFPADTFEARALLSQNNLYIAHRWMIIFHCLCVIISMLGLALIKGKENRGFILLGFVFYIVFGVTEMSRMFSVLEYLNPLRQQYLQATDIGIKTMLQQEIDRFNLVGFTLFSLFAFAFAVGNLCYGIAFSFSEDRGRWLGYGFLYWGIISLVNMGNDLVQLEWIDPLVDLNAKSFQPVFRLIIGVWLLRQAKAIP